MLSHRSCVTPALFPRSSKAGANASRILRKTPAWTQRLHRLPQVDPDGKRSGRSAHAAPVRSPHRLPWSTARLSCVTGRPRPSARRTGSGIKGARIAHGSSVSSARRPLPKRKHCPQLVNSPMYEMSCNQFVLRNLFLFPENVFEKVIEYCRTHDNIWFVFVMPEGRYQVNALQG